MKGLLLVLVALLLAFAAYAATSGHAARSGVWTAEIYDEAKVNLTIFTGRSENHWGNNMSGVTLPLARLEGLSKADGPSKFTLHAAAGTIAFEGHFEELKGAGHFTFAPSDAFLRDMDSLGYKDFRDDELLTFTTTDFTLETVRVLRSMGSEVSRRELEELAVGHVTPAYIAQLRELGYDHLTARQLSEMGIMKVTADYIRQMQGIKKKSRN